MKVGTREKNPPPVVTIRDLPIVAYQQAEELILQGYRFDPDNPPFSFQYSTSVSITMVLRQA
ncbi:hypothetical protein [Massilia sp. YMA4]|uniref:hypothetical protein n=1 Tax=Massilia sp. YMA4 TaxID=1593482 RepID=UPI0015815861|nr:hypothetical protein [Massilia sp. YMA4]